MSTALDNGRRPPRKPLAPSSLGAGRRPEADAEDKPAGRTEPLPAPLFTS